VIYFIIVGELGCRIIFLSFFVSGIDMSGKLIKRKAVGLPGHLPGQRKMLNTASQESLQVLDLQSGRA